MSNYNVSVSCILEFEEKVLMVQTVIKDKIYFALSHGDLNQSETIEEAAIRSVREKTGITSENPILVKIYQFIRNQNTAFDFLFYYKLSDWDVAKMKLQSEEIHPVRFFTKREIRTLLEQRLYENTLSAMKMTDYLGLDKENLSFCVVRG
jgi:ADP-ribose pyrophosphatase YjhB (NUDIX family)